MTDEQSFPRTTKKQREMDKREGPDGNPGKAGRVQGKGKASTSHKETGGKMAR